MSVVVAVDVFLPGKSITGAPVTECDRAEERCQKTKHQDGKGALVDDVSRADGEEGEEDGADALNPACGVVLLVPHDLKVS